MNEVFLSPVRIGDAARVRDALYEKNAIHEVASFIRQSISDSSQLWFVASVGESSDSRFLALVRLYSIDSNNKNTMLGFSFSSELRYSDDDRLLRKNVLDCVLRHVFFQMQLHKVSWIIRIEDFESESIALDCGMRQEAILEEVVFENELFSDAGLFSMLASEYPDYSVAFVRFAKGLIAIRGSQTHIEAVRFYAIGQKIEDIFDRSVAIRTGFASAQGNVLTDELSDSIQIQSHLPEELSKAVREMKEYLRKSRTRFSVRVAFSQGSEFQRHVWNEIQKIPYGSTVSYEDIALVLTANDRVSARNLSRAVGSACAENPIPIIVPCHRVIGKDGKLVGFSGGIQIKEFLLDHEIFGFFRNTDSKGEHA